MRDDDGLHPTPDPTLEVVHQAEAEKQYVGVEENSHPASPQTPRGLICGLERTTFYLVAALALAVVLAIALGGGLGTALRNKSSSSGSPTPTPVSESSGESSTLSSTTPAPTPNRSPTPTPTPSVEVLSIPGFTVRRDCPSSNGTTIEAGPEPSQKFIKYCSFLYKDDIIKVSPFTLRTASLDDCIMVCASYNAINGTGPLGPCSSVCWRTSPDDPSRLFGQCWGQYGTKAGIGKTATDRDVDNEPVDSALLIDD